MAQALDAGRPASSASLHRLVLDWYAGCARDLPWRRPDASPWEVFVSEVMSQQTPLSRVEPTWREWLRRWPTPAALASASPGEVVRAWGRLGYPRRALRLREAAVAMVDRHGGRVPDSVALLRQLPGVGEYTAAAVACFAYGIPAPVVDTNVRRVLARLLRGAEPTTVAPSRADRDLAAAVLPADATDAATWNVAVMELGSLVCTARNPRCGRCPVRAACAWSRRRHFADTSTAHRPDAAPQRRATSSSPGGADVAPGASPVTSASRREDPVSVRPADARPARRKQTWVGSDRQARGALLQVLRDSSVAASPTALREAWPLDEHQRQRCLAALVADGLAEPLDAGWFRLPV